MQKILSYVMVIMMLCIVMLLFRQGCQRQEQSASAAAPEVVIMRDTVTALDTAAIGRYFKKYLQGKNNDNSAAAIMAAISGIQSENGCLRQIILLNEQLQNVSDSLRQARAANRRLLERVLAAENCFKILEAEQLKEEAQQQAQVLDTAAYKPLCQRILAQKRNIFTLGDEGRYLYENEDRYNTVELTRFYAEGTAMYIAVEIGRNKDNMTVVLNDNMSPLFTYQQGNDWVFVFPKTNAAGTVHSRIALSFVIGDGSYEIITKYKTLTSKQIKL